MTNPAYPPGPVRITGPSPAPGWSSRAGRPPVIAPGFPGSAAARAGLRRGACPGDPALAGTPARRAPAYSVTFRRGHRARPSHLAKGRITDDMHTHTQGPAGRRRWPSPPPRMTTARCRAASFASMALFVRT